MMKKSRILSLAMAGALCIGLLAGCGNSSSSGDAQSPAPATGRALLLTPPRPP